MLRGNSAPLTVSPSRLTAEDIGHKLRVFAAPGDFKLENELATAVVRKKDGWLTELWSNRATLPTAKQLGVTTDIDALWRFFPMVQLGKRTFPVVASRVAMVPDGIETDGTADTGSSVYRAVTTYKMDRRRARVEIISRFSVVGGKASGGIKLGDSVKWGNVSYWVGGLPRPPMKFQGRTKWVGRRGAGGDLVLRPIDRPMWVKYSARIQGFQGTIDAVYHKGGIPKGGSVEVRRQLAFEPLPTPPPAEPKTTGTVELRIVDENGRGIPAKIRVDRPGSKRPLFEADGDLYGADRFMWTGNGNLSRDLAVGRYQFFVTSGIERDAHRQSIEVKKNRVTRVDAKLPRVVPTPGWIAADLHLHQAPSVDADISILERIVSVAAEGVEFAVATDHYVTTDLAPEVEWLRKRGALTVPLQTMVGSEVSTVGNRFGHFNVFPLATGKNIVYEDTTVDELFRDARKQSPGGVLQVNHPRMAPAISYWSYYGIDDNDGSMARKGYNPAFDTVEVYNGDEARDLKMVQRVLLDWIHQLGRGHRYAATGSSDSHKLAFLDPGLPRTMIRHGAGKSDDTDVAAPAGRIIDAIKAGRSFVTSGPMIEATIAGKGPGETATGVGRKPELRVVVRAAPWIDVTSLKVLVGGNAKQVEWVKISRSKKVLRLDKTLRVPIEKATFVIVTVSGQRGLPNTSRDFMQPFAFTNPIWVTP